MSMTRTCLISFAMLAVAAMGFQAPLNTPTDPSTAGDDVAGRVNVGGQGGYFRLNHIEGNGVGWNDGGSTAVGGWLPFNEFGADTLWYADLRAFLTNNGYVGGNAGLGVRGYNADWDRFFGGAVFYDYDHGTNNNGFGQITTSLETIGGFFDARANAYFPVSNSTRTLPGGEITGDPFFKNNRIFFPGTGMFLEALQGGDAEVGIPVSRDAQWLRAYAGYYAYNSNSHNDVEGFRGRLEAQLSDDLSVQGQVTDDRTFGTLVNLIVDVRLGGGRPIRAFPNLSSRERMYLPVQRNWRISTNTYKAPIEVVARDVNDHHKLEVAWVDNAAAPGGDGTFENPFQTLAGAEGVPAADFILVRHGTGDTYDGGITLKDNQRFLGEGVAHQFDAYAAFQKVSIQGTFTLPGFTNDPSLTPTITNSAGNAVTLANNNEVSSFIIDSPTGVAVFGSGITDFNLNHLEIKDPDLGGIVLNNAAGQGRIDTVTINGGFGPGMQIANVNTAPLNLDITNIGAVVGTTQALSIGANNSDIVANIDGYLASGNMSGLDITAAAGGTFTGQFLNSTFDGSTSGDGMRLTAVNPSSVINVAMRDTTAVNSFGNGLVVDSSDGAVIAADITNGDFSNSGLDGVRVLANDSATPNTLTMTDTPAANAGIDGFHAEITNNSIFTVDITNGDFSGAGQDAIDTTVDGGSILNLTIDPTPANGAGANGYRLQVANGSTLNANLIDVDLSDAALNGVLGNIDFGSTANLLLQRSVATGAGLDGMRITAANGSNFNALIEDGDFSDSGLNGINLALSSGSQGVITGLGGDPANLSSASNGLNGLLVDLQSGATLDAALSSGSFSDNLVNAINLTVDGTGTAANLNLTDIVATNSGADGFIFRAQNGGDVTATGTGGSFNNSGNHGIRGLIDNGSSASLDFDGTTAANSQADGLYITASGLSSFNGIFSNGSFANSGLNAASPNRNAVEISMDNSNGSLNLTNTAGNNSGQNGLLMTTQNGATLTTTVVDGNFNDSPLNAIQSNVSGAGSVNTLLLTDTTADNSGLDGLRFNVSNNGTFNATASGGSFNNSGDSGLRGVLDNSAQATLDFTNVAVNNSNDDGLLVSSTNASIFNGTFSGGSFSNSGQDAGSLNRNAVELLVNNSTNTLNMTHTAGNNAGADGLKFQVNNGGQLTGTLVGGTFANAGSNAVDGLTTGAGSSANVSLDGTLASNAGSDGVLLNAQSGSNLDFSFANSAISNSGANGVRLTADAAGTTTSLTLTNANVDNNGVTSGLVRDGVNLSATAGATIDVNLTSGTINGNRNDGIRAAVSGVGSNIDFNGNGTVVNGNLRGDGLGFTVTGGGSVTGGFVGGAFSNNGVVVAGNGVRGNVNGPGSVADLTFDGTGVDNNRADGFNMTALNSGSLTLNMINGASASNNLGYGINFLLDGPNSAGNLLMTGDNIVSNNGLGGILFNASNGAQTTSTISGNVSNNGGPGVSIIGTNLTINSLAFTGIYSNNAGQGINVALNNSTVDSLTVSDATVTNNAAQGVRLSGANGSHINNGLITNNTINLNGGDGILFSLANSDATLFSIDNNLEINQNAGSGVHVMLNTAPTNDFAITNNLGINDNTLNGVVFDLINSDLTDVLVSGNAIQGNLGTGLPLSGSGLQFTTATSNVSGAITDNVISGNTRGGLGITAKDGAAATNIDFGNTGLGHEISGNIINGNGNAGAGAGILANVGQNVHLDATIRDNIIRQNQSFGVGITSTDGSVDLTIGGATAADGNTFDQNVGAGVALTLNNSSTGVVDIENNTITQTVNSNATFAGDGINIRLQSTNVLNPSTAQLTATVISNNVIGDTTNAGLGNAGRGIVISNDGNSLINDLTLDNNVVANNGDDGIQFNKDGDANITNVSITNSLVTSNGGDGVQILVANGNQTTTFDIAHNDVTNNGDRGLSFIMAADSKIDVDITDNLLSGNRLQGINVGEQINDPTDQRDITGTWIQNRILNNGLPVGGASGIAILSAFGRSSALIIGQDGFDMNGVSLGNIIDGNGNFGISIAGDGNTIITNNIITNNGTGGIAIDSLGASSLTATLDKNLIALNDGNGLSFGATNTAFLSIVATENSIVNNSGRGVSVLNQVNATTFLQFGDGTIAGGNLISNNQGEGFYVVNTSSANQTQNAPATTALLADGALNVSPDMVLDLQFNSIINNGSPGNFPSSGLVLRVGTSNSAGPNLYSNGAAGVGNTGLVGNGRVNARVVNNEFGGNFGTDVLVESFTSTIDPVTSAGVWDAANFGPITAFQRDPLARLNMVFRDNTGDSLDVTRGESDRTVNGDPSTGAFYANPEGAFKSRLFTATPGGPFTLDTRGRNAQRLASANGPFAAPGFPGGAAGFAYDGVGDSTFRIESDFNTGGFTSGDTFLGDFGAVPPVANANGVPFTNPVFGELPFGWDTSVAVGTFQFLLP